MSEAAKMTPEAEKVWNACFPVPMETAVMLQQNTEQLGAYLVQMAQMMLRMQNRLDELEEKLHYQAAPRNKFVGTVYDQELLMKIRENAYGYFHGHEVGGTNPSLLEALSSTPLNLLLDVSFNREVGEDSALYWTKESCNLARLIDKADDLSAQDVKVLGEKARARIADAYSWQFICAEYEKLFLEASQ